ncbi:MAG: AI-2E family transporter [Armatimonadetes bacterium]|nr:AI-2E family transporter [Anaerolineae bacterium]
MSQLSQILQPQPGGESPIWNNRTKRTVIIICLVVAGIVLWQMSEVLPLLLITALLAYLLTPLVNFNQNVLLRWVPPGARRAVAVALAFIGVLLLFILMLLIVLPLLFEQLDEFGRSVPRILTNVESETERILSQPLTFNGEPILFDGTPLIPLERLEAVTGVEGGNLMQIDNLNLVATAQSFIGSLGGLTAPAFNVVGGALNVGVNLSFLLVMMFYLTKDGDKFLTKFVQLVPSGYESDARRLLHDLGVIWNGYLRGQLILCVTIGSAVFLAATLLGLPNAPILGLVAGILEFIPAIGPFSAMVLAVLLALVSTSTTFPFLSGASFVLATVAVYAVIQNVEAYFLVPRVMGDNLNLHPFAVIAAVVAGASLAGPLGIILAAPSLATARLVARYIYGKLMEVDPFVSPSKRRQAALSRSPGMMARISSWLAVRTARPATLPSTEAKNVEQQGG